MSHAETEYYLTRGDSRHEEISHKVELETEKRLRRARDKTEQRDKKEEGGRQSQKTPTAHSVNITGPEGPWPWCRRPHIRRPATASYFLVNERSEDEKEKGEKREERGEISQSKPYCLCVCSRPRLSARPVGTHSSSRA